MLVATFGPTTGWAGRTITFYDGRFTLEGHGLVTAHDVLEYDRQGHLLWAYDGLRDWAYSLAPPPAAPALTPPAAPLQAPPMQAPAQAPPGQVAPALAAPLQPAAPPPAQAATTLPAPLESAPAASTPPASSVPPAAQAESSEAGATSAAHDGPSAAQATPAAQTAPAAVPAAPLAVPAASPDAPAQAPDEPPASAADQTPPAAGQAPPAMKETPSPAAASGPPAAAAQAPAAVVVQDLWRAQCLDFDARVLAALAEQEAPAADVLARAARCVCWDFGAARPEQGRRAFTLYDREGSELHTAWAGAAATLPHAAATPPAPGGWILLDAPWAAMAVPAGWAGGAPEAAAQPVAAALQERGPDWAAWAGEWLTPLTTMYANSRGLRAALLFGVDLGAETLEAAGVGVFVREELDARRRDMTLQQRTDELVRLAGATGIVESVAYGTLAGWEASRIVAETRASFPHGPQSIHLVRYSFVDPPYAFSLDFTLPSSSASALGDADRCAAAFTFRG